ncbi:hypothetical protein NDU88_000928 [Pleurodeles waltl]|uniref:Uncharacterized protein n=1 Tax=Pleurodeles waltl TaxID=8319 RepID=A0AAV7NDP7_PLEWA|nr:hypothetical protein NDU88_000928 [Pleurodeles waltl]
MALEGLEEGRAPHGAGEGGGQLGRGGEMCAGAGSRNKGRRASESAIRTSESARVRASESARGPRIRECHPHIRECQGSAPGRSA